MKEEFKNIIDKLNKKSWELSRIDNVEGLKLAEKAELLSVYHNYKKGHGESFINKAWNNFSSTSFLEANHYFEKAKKVFKDIGNIEGILKANAGLSGILFNIGNFNDCLNLNIESIGLAKKHNLVEREITAVTSNALVYMELESYSDAIKCASKALSLGKEIDIFEQEPIILKLLADIYLYLGESEISIKYLNKAYNIYKDRNEFQGEFECLNTLGKYYSDNEDIKKAEYYFLLSVENAKGSPLEEFVLYEVAKFYFNQQNIKKSLYYLKSSLNKAKARDSKNCLKKIYKLLSEIAEKEGEEDKALSYYKESIKFEKIVRLEDANNNLDKLEVKLRIEEVKKENKQLTIKNKVMESISNISKQITSTLDTTEISKLIYENIKGLMHVTTFGLAYYDEELCEIDFKIFVENENYIKLRKLKIQDENSFTCWAIRNRTDILVSDFEVEHKKYIGEQGATGLNTNSLIYLPLYFDNKIVGLLTVQSTRKNIYSQEHIEILELIRPFLSIAINNSSEHRKICDLNIKLKKSYKEIQEVSYTDYLTGLYNRRYFSNVVFSKYLKRIKEKSLSFLFIDIDYFKIVNMTHGFRSGDNVLDQVSKRIMKTVVKESELLRWGGEEFLLLVQNKNLLEIKSYADKVLKTISSHPFYVGNKKVSLTVSIGYVYIPEIDNLSTDLSWEVLTNIAEQALGKAKQLGRNCTVGYSLNKDKTDITTGDIEINNMEECVIAG